MSDISFSEGKSLTATRKWGRAIRRSDAHRWFEHRLFLWWNGSVALIGVALVVPEIPTKTAVLTPDIGTENLIRRVTYA